MDFKILKETQARELPGFIRPDLLEDDMSDYFFYIAEDERGILGMAVIDPVLTGPELLSIAVIPSALRTGVGTQLLIYVKRDLERMLGMQEKGFDTYALFALMTPAMAQEKALTGFLKSNLFFEAERNSIYQFCIHDLLSSNLLGRGKTGSDYKVMPLKAVSNTQLAVFSTELDNMGRFADYDYESMDRDISMFVIEGKRIIGCALFTRVEEKLLDNEWIYMENAVTRPQVLIAMLNASFEEAEDIMPEKSEVAFVIESREGEKLLKSLMPNAKPTDEIISMATPLYPADPAIEERMTSDLGMRMITEEIMVCKNCRQSEGDVLSCALYSKKPEAVLDGEDCPHFTGK